MNLIDNLIKEGFSINIVGDRLNIPNVKNSWFFEKQ